MGFTNSYLSPIVCPSLPRSYGRNCLYHEAWKIRVDQWGNPPGMLTRSTAEKLYMKVGQWIFCLKRKYDFSEMCVLPASLAWWLAHSFSKTSPWILTRFTSNKNWRKLNWNDKFVSRKKLKKNELTILQWQKQDLPSYDGVVRGCRFQVKPKAHTLSTLA